MRLGWPAKVTTVGVAAQTFRALFCVFGQNGLVAQVDPVEDPNAHYAGSQIGLARGANHTLGNDHACSAL